MIKIKFLLISVFLILANCSFSYAQFSRTNQIFRPCPNTSAKAVVQILTDGNIEITTCNGGNVLVDANSALLKLLDSLPNPNTCNVNDNDKTIIAIKNDGLYQCLAGEYSKVQGGTSSGTIENASATQTGLLTNTDWTNFNNKISGNRSITTGTGLTGGGDLTANRTISLTNTTVNAGDYLNANISVDSQGRITSAASGNGNGGVSYVEVVSNVTELNTAITTANANPLNRYFINIVGKIDLANSGKIFPANTIVTFGNLGKFDETLDGSTLRFNGIIDAPRIYIFENFEPTDIKISSQTAEIYPDWFGAKCEFNGSDATSGTDDWKAFQSAIDAIASSTTVASTSGKITFTGGCYISDTLTIDHYTLIEGYQGGGKYFGNSVLAFAAGKMGINLRQTGFENAGNIPGSAGSMIKNLTLQSLGKTGVRGFGIRTLSEIHIENVNLKNFENDAIAIVPHESYSNANASTIKNVTVENIGRTLNDPIAATVSANSNVIDCQSCNFDSTSTASWARIKDGRQLNISAASFSGDTVTIKSNNHNLVHTFGVKISGLDANGLVGADGTIVYINVIDANTFSYTRTGVSGTYSGTGGVIIADLNGQLHYDASSTPTSIKLVGAGEVRGHSYRPLNITNPKLTNATMLLLGSGVNINGDNAQVIYIEQLNCLLTAGSCLVDEGNYGSQVNTLHSSGAKYFAININPFDPTVTNLPPTEYANGSCLNCYIEGTGSSYPVNIIGNGYTYTGNNGAGFQLGSKGYFFDRTVARFQPSLSLGVPVLGNTDDSKLTVFGNNLQSPIKSFGIQYALGGNFQVWDGGTIPNIIGVSGVSASYFGNGSKSTGGYFQSSADGTNGVAVGVDSQVLSGTTQIGVRTNSDVYLSNGGIILRDTVTGECRKISLTSGAITPSAVIACPPVS